MRAQDGGGILLDRASGNILQLNELATDIWSDHLRGLSAKEIASSERYPRELELIDIERVLQLPTRVATDPGLGNVDYHWDPQRRRLSCRDDDVFELSEDGTEVRRLVSPSLGSVRQDLACIATKALGFAGALVLHGSAVLARDKLLVISGVSGAGKTTTARAFAQCGARLVSEDKLLVTVRDESCAIDPQGEGRINRWIEESYATLISGSTAALSTRNLLWVEDAGTPLTVGHFYLLSRETRVRGASTFAAKPIAKAVAVGDAIRQVFFGSPNWEVWKRHADMVNQVLYAAATFELRAPDGSEWLCNAATDYILNLTE